MRDEKDTNLYKVLQSKNHFKTATRRADPVGQITTTFLLVQLVR
jgi:hypothetical protein